MSFPVQCPACRYAFQVDERFAGKQGKCPRCGAVLTAEPLKPVKLGARPAGPDLPVARPPADDSQLAHPPVSPVVAAAIAEPSEVTQSATVSTGRWPLVIGGSIGVAVLLSLLVALTIWQLGGRLPADDGDPAAAGELPTDEQLARNAVVPRVAHASPPVDVTKLAELRRRVLRLSITMPQGTFDAAGFVVDAEGHVATALHVLRGATEIAAVTPADMRVPVAGTVAVDEAHDLAILQLAPTVPLGLTPLELDGDAALPAGTSIAAFNVGDETTPVISGTAQATLPLSRLVGQTRAAIDATNLPWADDASLVLHDLHLVTASVGAPLVDSAGHVVACHVVNSRASGGVAVHAKHLVRLIATMTDEVQPLSALLAAATPAIEPGPAAPPPAPADNSVALALESVKKHQLDCSHFRWQASSGQEYARLQDYALAITAAATLADAPDTAAADKDKLLAAAQAALLAIVPEAFEIVDYWKSTNGLAVKALLGEGEVLTNKGVLVLGKVVVPASAGNKVEDLPVALVELEGTTHLVAVTCAQQSERFVLNQRVLVVGVQERGSTVTFKERLAEVVRCKLVLFVD